MICKKKIKRNFVKYNFLVITFFVFFSYFIAIGYTSSTVVFNGMYINYIHSDSYHYGETFNARVTFSSVTAETCHVKWNTGQGGETGNWDENLNTRIVSNTILPGPVPGDHTWTRILTNVSLNDIIPIFIYLDGDHNFNITLKLNWTLPGNGPVEVWQLEDSSGSVVWYESSTGILLNGTFYGSGFWKKAEFVSTNVFSGIYTGGFPAIAFITSFTILGASIMSVIVLIRYKRKES
ncbi:MAG: hypothetical protein ACFFDF_06515 [Candidatus Odinarchaeota archaeon]